MKAVDQLEKFKHVKILLGIPTSGMVYSDFMISLCNLVVACQTHRIGQFGDQTVSTMLAKGSMLAKQRMEIVQHALEKDYSYVLFLDTDHTFPRGTLHRLLDWRLPVVAVNCVTKTIPANPTARSLPTPTAEWGSPVFTDEKSGIERVWRVGTGIMLVDCEVFKKTGHKIFNMFYREDVGTYQGEDWSMCEAIEKAGYDIYVDHGLSREVGHLGTYNYTHDVVGTVVERKDGEEQRKVG